MKYLVAVLFIFNVFADEPNWSAPIPASKFRLDYKHDPGFRQDNHSFAVEYTADGLVSSVPMRVRGTSKEIDGHTSQRALSRMRDIIGRIMEEKKKHEYVQSNEEK